jgi:glycosyltransferase involved in cell wall biosynthesis
MVIPCRNESGNLAKIFEKLLTFESVDEIIFVEGGSEDNTFNMISDYLSSNRVNNMKLIKQTGKGKFRAVYEAVQIANGDHVAIWDSDLTINALDQSLIISVYLLQPDRPKFVTANRLNPQIADGAMRRLNLYGNHIFSRLNFMATGINIPDVLAGTKVFPKILLTGEGICERALELDPFGDLFLICRAKYFDLHVISLNCEYQGGLVGAK